MHKYCCCGCGNKVKNEFYKGHARRINCPERFWEKVDKTNNCWLWEGSINKNGYGTLHYMKKMSLAHRISYLIHFGTLDDTLVIDHLCRNRSCVNPTHLEQVTIGENVKRGFPGKHNNHVRGINHYLRMRKSCSRGHIYRKNSFVLTKQNKRLCLICEKIRRSIAYKKKKVR